MKTSYFVGIVVMIILSCFLSCTSDKKIELSHQVYELSEIESMVSTDGIFDEINVFTPKNTDDAILGNVRKIAADNSTYFILCINGSVLAFDYSGNYKYKVGRVGNGPGEYSRPHDITIDPATGYVAVLDFKKILFYDPFDGTFSHDIKLDVNAKEMSLDDSHIILSCPPCPNGRPADSEILIIDRKTGIKSGYLPASNNNCTSLDFPNRELNTSNNRTFFSRKFDNRIYMVNDTVAEAIEITDKSNFITSTDNATGPKLIEFMQKCHEDNKIFFIGDFMKNDSNIFFSTNLGYVIGDVSDKQLNQCHALKSSRFDIVLSSCYVINGRNNEIIFTIYPQSVYNTIQAGLANSDLITLGKDLDEESNPIMVHYKLR
ncbi:6-bladed beta-propeller [Duncaniella freteri]|uniref:6-bladed beta-propeller n=4 Tax=Duncaniella TaxID=2518495 RepID=UPI001369F951|nr:6-bladed beta-propeller [Duncaniella freteri]NBJ09175.1 6-bladed beta-propeller [Alistipes sp. Z76]NCE71179.1 6-bladed beta-propeller [Muribaculaceae bacterium M3]